MRKIKYVPKDERISFNEGNHNLPSWLVVVFIMVIFGGMYLLIF